MRGNFGLFRTFSPKLPRIHVDYIVMQMRKINREKGYFIRFAQILFPELTSTEKPGSLL